MKSSTILHEITPDEIFNIVNEAIQKQLADFKKSFEPKQLDELMTGVEVKEMFKCDITTIYNWTKKGKLKKHGIGNRTYYKLSEVLAALKPL